MKLSHPAYKGSPVGVVFTGLTFIFASFSGIIYFMKSETKLRLFFFSKKTIVTLRGDWGTTDKGAVFSMCHKGVLNSDAWHPELVDEIIKFLKK